jgi:hypothetical protein
VEQEPQVLIMQVVIKEQPVEQEQQVQLTELQQQEVEEVEVEVGEQLLDREDLEVEGQDQKMVLQQHQEQLTQGWSRWLWNRNHKIQIPIIKLNESE